jgi:hypothetical protein
MTTPSILKKAIVVLPALFASVSAVAGGDQAKAIINALDPKSMNELFEVSRRQPDAALTNIAPVSANTFRFLFIWPAFNPTMTYDRVARSFAERFTAFAEQMKPLAIGFCLPSNNIYFGTAMYGEEEVNVAYRDIEVRYQFGRRAACSGRYISMADLEQSGRPQQSPGHSAAFPRMPVSPPEQPANPEDGLKPFLAPPPNGPLE